MDNLPLLGHILSMNFQSCLNELILTIPLKTGYDLHSIIEIEFLTSN
jgi:hypothetical protein